MSSYLLIIHGPRHTLVRVGALGELSLEPGIYLYVGSARRGLAARLQRHQRPDKKRRWHIDYLLSGDALTIQAIWTGDQMAECQLAAGLLTLPGVTIPRRRLGASDCRCPAHFFRYDGNPATLAHHLLAFGLSPFPMSEVAGKSGIF